MSYGEFRAAENNGSLATITVSDGGSIVTTAPSGGFRLGYGTGIVNITVTGAGSVITAEIIAGRGRNGSGNADPVR